MGMYVTVGAGFDRLSLRRLAFAREVEGYELEHPATQRLELRRLKECGFSFQESTHLVAVDFSA
jgi:O-methyltransferase involved in polyketide biosynthesis